MSTPEQVETPKPRTLYGGVMKVLSGVEDIQEALKKWRFWFALAGSFLAVGGVFDRTQGFPMLKRALAPILASNNNGHLEAEIRAMREHSDSATKSVLEKIDTVSHDVQGIKDSVSRMNERLGKTQAVVNRIAVLTKTQKTIIHEQEKQHSLFGDIWGLR